MIICPNCGTQNSDYARFCLECGSSLTDDSPECPACNFGRLSEGKKKGFLGTKYQYTCNHCGAVFEEKGSKYKLISIRDLDNPVWQRYHNKRLSFEEWARIANGGVSDAEQRRLDAEEKLRKQLEDKEQRKLVEEKRKMEIRKAEAQKERDINQFLNKLGNGLVNITSSSASPIILKKNEVASLVLFNISFLEPRMVRQTRGGYGGPSIRLAKGISFRFGGVSARSESHEELKKIDQGTLILTTKRLVFIGSKRTVNIDLRKILAIEPYKDGIGSQRENKQKTEYFIGTDKTTLTFTNEGRSISIPVNGVVLKAAIMGNINKLG